MNSPIPSDRPQPLLEHLDELRGRMIVVLTAVTALSILSYSQVDALIERMAATTGGFVFFSPTEAFLVRLNMALTLGGFLSIPVLIHQAWRFVGVALVPAERRVTAWILPVSYALFVCGLACAWLVVIPSAVRFLLGYSTASLKPMISLEAYFGFVVWTLTAFGLMFQTPLIVFFLIKSGVTTPEALTGYRRHVLVGLSVAAAFLTPGPDIISQLALLAPTYFLFEAAVLLARWTEAGGHYVAKEPL